MYFIDIKVNMSFHLNPILKVTYLELVTMTQTYTSKTLKGLTPLQNGNYSTRTIRGRG